MSSFTDGVDAASCWWLASDAQNGEAVMQSQPIELMRGANAFSPIVLTDDDMSRPRKRDRGIVAPRACNPASLSRARR